MPSSATLQVLDNGGLCSVTIPRMFRTLTMPPATLIRSYFRLVVTARAKF